MTINGIEVPRKKVKTYLFSKTFKMAETGDSTSAQVSSWSQQKKEDLINALKGDHGNEEKNNESIMYVSNEIESLHGPIDRLVRVFPRQKRKKDSGEEYELNAKAGYSEAIN